MNEITFTTKNNYTYRLFMLVIYCVFSLPMFFYDYRQGNPLIYIIDLLHIYFLLYLIYTIKHLFVDIFTPNQLIARIHNDKICISRKYKNSTIKDIIQIDPSYYHSFSIKKYFYLGELNFFSLTIYPINPMHQSIHFSDSPLAKSFSHESINQLRFFLSNHKLKFVN